MAFLLGLVAIGAGVWAWKRWGILPGIAAFVLTYPVLTLIVAGISFLLPGRREREEFVKAFEERGGRMGLDPGATNLAANREYWQWRDARTGMSAGEWLDKKYGLAPPRLEGSPFRFLSGWQYGVVDWPPDEPTGLTASRWFDYERFNPFGSPMRFVHSEYCPHLHRTNEEAQGCVDEFVARGGVPGAEDVDRANSGVPWRNGEVVAGASRVRGIVGPVKEGLRWGDSVLFWSDIESIVWRSGAATFTVVPRLFLKSDEGERVALRTIEVLDLGDAQTAWERYIGALRPRIPTHRAP